MVVGITGPRGRINVNQGQANDERVAASVSSHAPLRSDDKSEYSARTHLDHHPRRCDRPRHIRKSAGYSGNAWREDVSSRSITSAQSFRAAVHVGCRVDHLVCDDLLDPASAVRCATTDVEPEESRTADPWRGCHIRCVIGYDGRSRVCADLHTVRIAAAFYYLSSCRTETGSRSLDCGRGNRDCNRAEKTQRTISGRARAA